VLLSPHMGYGQDETINFWYEENAKNLKKWLKGEKMEALLT